MKAQQHGCQLCFCFLITHFAVWPFWINLSWMTKLEVEREVGVNSEYNDYLGKRLAFGGLTLRLYLAQIYVRDIKLLLKGLSCINIDNLRLFPEVSTLVLNWSPSSQRNYASEANEFKERILFTDCECYLVVQRSAGNLISSAS